MGDIIVLSIIGLVVALIIASLIRNKKKGKSACSGGCANCAHSHHCQPHHDEKH